MCEAWVRGTLMIGITIFILFYTARLCSSFRLRNFSFACYVTSDPQSAGAILELGAKRKRATME